MENIITYKFFQSIIIFWKVIGSTSNNLFKMKNKIMKKINLGKFNQVVVL